MSRLLRILLPLVLLIVAARVAAAEPLYPTPEFSKHQIPTSIPPDTRSTLLEYLDLAALLVGFGLGRLAGMDRAEWIAVGLAGSQKTLMIGLHIAVTQDLGLAVLPMVAYHAVQLLLDTVVADRLRRGDVTAVGG